VRALLEVLPSALDGTGPAIAPIPTTSVTVGNSYVERVLAATRPDDPATPLESNDTAVVLATSGSTGTPRGVMLSTTALTAIDTAVVGGATPTWIVAIPVTSAGGFNVLMRSMASGTEPITLPSVGGGSPFSPATFSAAVTQAHTTNGDVRTSLVAAQLRRLLADESSTEALQSCSLVLIGGGPLDAHTRAVAEELRVPIVSTYGATETAGGCVYNGIALPGVAVSIATNGEVLINGDVLALGYRLDPEATSLRFTAAGYRTGDLGEVRNGVLRITGRMDDVVVVNGINVSVIAVEEALRSLPDVVNAAAVWTPTRTEPAITAFMQVRDGSDARTVTGQAQDFIAAELGRAAVPRVIECVETVPALPNGKPDRVALRAAAADLLGS
jgi:o-succinylbenzoate---CoA ligase